MPTREKITEVDSIDSELYKVFDHIDRLLIEEDYAAVDEILQGVEVGKLPLDLLVGHLTITLVARNKLQARAEFFDKVRERLLREKEDEVDLILQGLG